MEINDKKKHLLETAEKLFASKGYEAATVRDIAEAANVNLSMISYYFGSKEKLLESLFHERMLATKITVEQIYLNRELTPFEKVQSVLANYINKVLSNQSFYKILICEQIMQKNPEVISQLKALKLEYAKMFEELVKEGQKKKLFKKNIDVALALHTMTGTVTQLMINKEFYIDFHGLVLDDEATLQKQLHAILLNHLTPIFKTILGYES